MLNTVYLTTDRSIQGGYKRSMDLTAGSTDTTDSLNIITEDYTRPANVPSIHTEKLHSNLHDNDASINGSARSHSPNYWESNIGQSAANQIGSAPPHDFQPLDWKQSNTATKDTAMVLSPRDEADDNNHRFNSTYAAGSAVQVAKKAMNKTSKY